MTDVENRVVLKSEEAAELPTRVDKRLPWNEQVVRAGATIAAAAAGVYASVDLVHSIAGHHLFVFSATSSLEATKLGIAASSVIWFGLLVSLIGFLLGRKKPDSAAVRDVPGTDVRDLPRFLRKERLLPIAIGLAFVITVYHGLFAPGAISWGDWGYYANASAVRSFFPTPSLWTYANLGSSNTLGLPLYPILSLAGVMAHLGIPYWAIERMLFYFPAVGLSFTGVVVLLRRLGSSQWLAAGCAVFYVVNPYALDIISGGQLTVGMGYALYPWVGWSFARLVETRSWSRAAIAGLILGVQSWYDPRSAWLSVVGLTLVAVSLAVGKVRNSSKLTLRSWKYVVFALVVAGCLQGPWVVPSLAGHHVPDLPTTYVTPAALKTLSFMSLADGLTIFHPFWPKMIFIELFGLPAIWMILPLALALATLCAVESGRKAAGTYAALTVYLAFSALVVGSNPPFGSLNTWVFVHVPFMDVFRDPSPFFGLAALAATVVIGVGLSGVTSGTAHGRYMSDPRRYVPATRFVLAVGAIGLVVASWPALSGTLRHDLAPVSIPAGIREANSYIAGLPPGNVLWVPEPSQFALDDPLHPTVSAYILESLDEIDFPYPYPYSLEWTTSVNAFSHVLSTYHISEVVLDADPSLYSDLSVPFRLNGLAARALSSLPMRRFGNVQVFRTQMVGELISLSAFTPTSKAGVLGDQRETVPSKALGPELLATTSFDAGAGSWLGPGDSDNYARLSLAQAGISAGIGGSKGQRWLHLTVAKGAASMTQDCGRPSGDALQLSVRYRTTGDATLDAYVLESSQPYGLAALDLGGTGGAWVTRSVHLLLEVDPREMTHSLELELVLKPLSNKAVSADLQEGSLRSITDTQPATGTTRTDAIQAESLSDGATLKFLVPASESERTLDLWQMYDPGWQIQSSSSRRQHSEKDGWANAFVIPASQRPKWYTLHYEPQGAVNWGFVVALVTLVVIVIMLVFCRAGNRPIMSSRRPGSPDSRPGDISR